MIHLKEISQRVLKVNFDFEIKESQGKGLTVRYDGKSAEISGESIPAIARGYMLLAQAVANGKKDLSISQEASFSLCGVMLDMSFGSVTKPEAVKRYLEYMALFGMNMLMLYTEDTYELEGYPLFGYQRGRYTLDELRDIDDYANALGIEVIPCIQTFGHLGKFLRHKKHKNIAENDRVLLPGEPKTYEFIEACIKTCRAAFRSDRIHIGCDETGGLGFGKSFQRDGLRDRFEIYNEHLQKVVKICEAYQYRPMMWSDMYFTLAAAGSGGYNVNTKVPQYAIDSMPNADMVFWNYYHIDNDFYRINIEKHRSFNRETLFAGGVWTWNGHAPNFIHTYNTVKPALEECLKAGVRSVFGAAWAYGDINHMQALPCLAIYSEYCWRGLDCTRDDIDQIAEFVTGLPREYCDAISDFYCGTGGDTCIGRHILWADPLIHLLCYGFDFEKYEQCFRNSLEIFEKYPNAPECDFYKALFRSVLNKTIVYQNLRDRYKAGDREWLENFADKIVPEMLSDYQELYDLHEALWHRDHKTQGYEKLASRYATAIDRIRYAGKQVHRYLNGEISEIEALEPEIILGEPQKHIGTDRIMYTY